MSTIVVPAPTKAGFASIKTNQRKRLSKRELNITPHYGCSRVGAGTTIKSDANEVVPAPRLELESESLNDLRSILCELAKNAKLEMKRGNKGAVEELLEVFIESGEKFSTFEKNILENGVISCKGPDSIRVDPITNPLILEVTL